MGGILYFDFYDQTKQQQMKPSQSSLFNIPFLPKFPIELTQFIFVFVQSVWLFP